MPKGTCRVDGCERPQRCRELCRFHWDRLRKYGPDFETLVIKRRTKPRMPLAERFWAKVDKSGDCWVWTASKVAFNYGSFQLGRGEGARLTHRLSWELAHGPIPSGLCVLHKCDNPPCVRPEHLFLGTRIDNNLDMVAKGRNSFGRLDPMRVLAIRRARDEGLSYNKLAAQFHCTPYTARMVVERQWWGRVA